MKFLGVLIVLVAVTTAAPSSGYLELLMAFDFEALLNNDEQRKIAFDCMLQKGSCGEFQPLYDGVVKVVKNKCAECSPEQKQKYDHVIKLLKERYEPEFNEFLKKHGAAR